MWDNSAALLAIASLYGDEDPDDYLDDDLDEPLPSRPVGDVRAASR